MLWDGHWGHGHTRRIGTSWHIQRETDKTNYNFGLWKVSRSSYRLIYLTHYIFVPTNKIHIFFINFVLFWILVFRENGWPNWEYWIEYTKYSDFRTLQCGTDHYVRSTRQATNQTNAAALWQKLSHRAGSIISQVLWARTTGKNWTRYTAKAQSDFDQTKNRGQSDSLFTKLYWELLFDGNIIES